VTSETISNTDPNTDPNAGPNTGPKIDQEIDQKIGEAVASATAALKENRDKILEEKKKLSAQFKEYQDQLGDVDPLEAKAAIEHLRILEREKEDLLNGHQSVLEQLKTVSFEKLVTEKAVQAGIRHEALPDVLTRAQMEGWEVEPSGALKNGQAEGVSVDTWLQQLREKAPHLYVGSSGGGAASSGASGRGSRSGFVNQYDLQDIAQGNITF